MKRTLHYSVEKKEHIYLIIKYIISALAYSGYAFLMYKTNSLLLLAAGIFFICFIVRRLSMHMSGIGYIETNGVRINENQFPEVFEILKSQSKEMGLKKVPSMYLLLDAGMINAFSARFTGRNYLILHADILGAAYEKGAHVVEFIIGHELGHLKRNHVSLFHAIFTLPARLIPFLDLAYLRACEFTCDKIGYAFSPEGAFEGMLILVSGRELRRSINIKELINTYKAEKGFITWFSTIHSTHPPIADRIAHFQKLIEADIHKHKRIITK